MNINRKISLSLACIVLLQVSLLEAKTDLEPVVITASKTENSLKDISTAAQIITAEQIKQKGATRLRDIIKFSVGVYNPTQDSISIRGFNAGHTLLLIDGRRLTGEVGGSLEIDRINVNNIQRIEIIRGAASGLYGTDSLGGVINIITKKHPKDFLTTIDLKYGAFGSDGKQQSLGFNSQMPISDKLSLSLYGALRTTDRLDNERKKSIQRDGKVNTIGLDINYQIDKADEIIFNTDFMKDDGDNFINNGIVKMIDDNERQNYSLLWERTKDDYNSKVRVYTSLYDKTFEVFHTKKNKYMKFVKAERETSVAETQISFSPIDKNLVMVGAELRRESFEGNIIETGKNTTKGTYKGMPYQNSKIEIDYYSLFLQDELFISDKLSAIASVRYDDSDVFESDFSPKVGLTYHMIDEKNRTLMLKTNYSHGFKTPTPADMYLKNVRHDKKMLLTGNPNLTSEKSNTYDISLEGEYKQFSSKISYFHSDIEDLIEKVFTGKVNPDTKYKIFSYENLSEATIDGLEFEASYEISQSAGVSMNYTFLDAEGDIRSGRAFKTMRLEGRPEHLANVKAYYNYLPWDMQVNLWGEYVGNMLLNHKRNEQNIVVGENEKSYTLLYTSLTKKFSDSFEVYAGVDNITDKKDDDIPLLGAFAYAGVRYTF